MSVFLKAGGREQVWAKHTILQSSSQGGDRGQGEGLPFSSVCLPWFAFLGLAPPALNSGLKTRVPVGVPHDCLSKRHPAHKPPRLIFSPLLSDGVRGMKMGRTAQVGDLQHRMHATRVALEPRCHVARRSSPAQQGQLAVPAFWFAQKLLIFIQVY